MITYFRFIRSHDISVLNCSVACVIHVCSGVEFKVGNKATKKITEHPLTTAILEKNLPLFEDLMTEHLESPGNIKVSFVNEYEEITFDR